MGSGMAQRPFGISTSKTGCKQCRRRSCVKVRELHRSTPDRRIRADFFAPGVWRRALAYSKGFRELRSALETNERNSTLDFSPVGRRQECATRIGEFARESWTADARRAGVECRRRVIGADPVSIPSTLQLPRTKAQGVDAIMR